MCVCVCVYLYLNLLFCLFKVDYCRGERPERVCPVSAGSATAVSETKQVASLTVKMGTAKNAINILQRGSAAPENCVL